MCEILLTKYISKEITSEDIEELDLVDIDILTIAETQNLSYESAALFISRLNKTLGLFRRINIVGKV